MLQKRKFTTRDIGTVLAIAGQKVTNVIFMHTDGHIIPPRDTLCRNIVIAVSTVIALPSEVQIQYMDLGESMYGVTMVDYRIHNRVKLNSVLTLSEVPLVLVHELIHLHQYFTGQLRTTRAGNYYWNNSQVIVDSTISYDTYLNLPWERDVTEKLPKIMASAVEYALAQR